MLASKTTVRVAAIADIHFSKAATETVRPLLAQVSEDADILLLCGDLTNYGLPEEAQSLARELAAVRIPMIAVLGNHDFQSDKQDEVKRILAEAGVHMLDGDACELYGIGFAGVKGFAGGFDQRLLQPWGERTVKQFVHEALDEALKLESALAQLRTPRSLVLLHYAPIRATVEGEPLEIFPFLGSSRLEEPLNRHNVTAVFHGHAHRGSLEGRTRGGVPVYNVAQPLLQHLFPDKKPYYVLSVALSEAAESPAPTT